MYIRSNLSNDRATFYSSIEKFLDMLARKESTQGYRLDCRRVSDKKNT